MSGFYLEGMMSLVDKTTIKFIAVGVVNTLFGSALMFLLYNVFGFSYWLSSAANYIAGSILSFFLNKYFTFGVKEWNVKMIVGFIINILFCYFIAYGVARPLVNTLLNDNSQRIRENLALFAGMCLFTGLNYIGQRFFVFNSRQTKK